MTRLLLLLIITLGYTAQALEIERTPIDYFKRERMALTKAYIASHYGLSVRNATITPKIVVIHATGTADLESAFERFKSPILSRERSDIAAGGSLNVSVHYLVDRDGTVYQLMPENQMARHVIGLNYSSIGIENVGGVKDREDLTPEQMRANVALVKMLQGKYEELEYLIGHYEYSCFEGHELWLERDANYRNAKKDPGESFMQALHGSIVGMRRAPCD